MTFRQTIALVNQGARGQSDRGPFRWSVNTGKMPPPWSGTGRGRRRMETRNEDAADLGPRLGGYTEVAWESDAACALVQEERVEPAYPELGADHGAHVCDRRPLAGLSRLRPRCSPRRRATQDPSSRSIPGAPAPPLGARGDLGCPDWEAHSEPVERRGFLYWRFHTGSPAERCVRKR